VTAVVVHAACAGAEKSCAGGAQAAESAGGVCGGGGSVSVHVESGTVRWCAVVGVGRDGAFEGVK
jgi:hypothetical protein